MTPVGTHYDSRPTLIGYLPPPEGIRKTGANYPGHSQFINIGDIVYAYAGAMLTSGRNFEAWNFRMSAEEVNEKFSNVVFFIPCRIAPSLYEQDGYPYEFVTRFIERLRIPFFSLGESIQAREYEYDPAFHKSLSPRVVRYLKTIADTSPLVGTRGEYSADVLSKLGIKTAAPLGCPSLYLNGPSLPVSLLSVPKQPEKVGVCYSNYQGNSHSRIEDFLRLADRAGYHYVEQTFGLVTQALYYPGKLSGEDIYTARRVYRDLAPLLSLLKKGQVRYFTNYRVWKDFLGTMNFAFGARMHGLTPALHAGVPAVFIAHDARVREMCEFFSLPFVSERELPEEMNIDFFLSRCDYVPASERYKVAYGEFFRTLHRHGLGENIDAQGRIIDNWMPEPDPQVLHEEGSVRHTAEDMSSLERQVSICSEISDDIFLKLNQIKALAHDEYLLRLNKGTGYKK